MNKQEKIVVALLFLALVGWMLNQRREDQRRAEEYRSPHTADHPASHELPTDPGTDPDGLPDGEEASRPLAETPDERRPGLPEATAVLSSDVCRIVLTSHGGGIRETALLHYPETLDAPPGSVVRLAFAHHPALSLEGIPGIDRRSDFSLEHGKDASRIVLRATGDNGLQLERHLVLTNGYRLAVTDRFRNTGESVLEVPLHRILLGKVHAASDAGDDTALAADFRVPGSGRKPDYPEIGKARLAGLFGGSGGGGCSSASVPAGAPGSASLELTDAVTWGAVRSRFFVQVLTPSETASGAAIHAVRTADASGAFRISELGASLEMPPLELLPGEERERLFDYYVGPRKMASLRALGSGQGHIMRFGMWRVFCEGLLDLLNLLYGVVPNYGVAIILLTGLVRLVMYPITRRGAESMRRMQALQPKLKEIQSLYKEEPQKLQRETMQIYRENKVNPLSSCLPMLIQLPVFIALFTVLRGAVELRFAPFLWVADLSSPENLFQESLGFGLNILPILMSGTMALQSYLTPTAGDPAQQRMMMVLMPGMMLVMFYTFPAALGLYWTTSQILAICGLLWVRRKNAAAKGEEGMEVIPPPKETRQMRRSKVR